SPRMPRGWTARSHRSTRPMIVNPRMALVLGVLALSAVLSGQETAKKRTVDWPLHNLDLHNSRYAPVDQITASNANRVATKWTFQTEKSEGIGAVTPVVVDGVMYFNAGSKLFAVNAATGTQAWTFALDASFAGGRRGPAYGDGRIYAVGQRYLYVVDAK